MVLQLHPGSQTRFQCAYVGNTPSNSQTPAGCPRTQPTSDATYPVTAPESQVKGFVLQDCPPLPSPGTGHKLKVPVLLTYQLQLEVPTTSLGSINLPEWLTELRVTYYLLDHQFILKSCNSGTARWKRGIGQGMGKGRRASKCSLGIPLSQHLHMSPASKLSRPWPHYMGVIE